MNIQDLYSLYQKNYKVCTDTRKIEKDCIFFALKGENFDANRLAASAIESGAQMAVIDNPNYSIKGKTFLVEDVLRFLQKFANYHRKQIQHDFVGITGSNGKTTTKELAHAVLSKKYKCSATKGNFNNHIGVPLTLLDINPDYNMSIIEMGANHQGEIAELCKIAMPNMGYITNYGMAHLEGFGGFEGVVKGKSELYNYILSTGGRAMINPQDELQMEKSKNLSRIYMVDDLHIETTDPFLKLSYKGNIINTSIIGSYNYNNIRFAISLGEYYGIELEKIISAIEEYVPSNNRSQELKIGANKFILDAYNANPSSVKLAVENFDALESDNKIIVLGDMFELGEYSFDLHGQIVKQVTELHFDKMFFIGSEYYKHKNSKAIFIESKSDFDFAKFFFEQKDALILIKGSRGMKLEDLIK